MSFHIVVIGRNLNTTRTSELSPLGPPAFQILEGCAHCRKVALIEYDASGSPKSMAPGTSEMYLLCFADAAAGTQWLEAEAAWLNDPDKIVYTMDGALTG